MHGGVAGVGGRPPPLCRSNALASAFRPDRRPFGSNPHELVVQTTEVMLPRPLLRPGNFFGKIFGTNCSGVHPPGKTGPGNLSTSQLVAQAAHLAPCCLKLTLLDQLVLKRHGQLTDEQIHQPG